MTLRLPFSLLPACLALSLVAGCAAPVTSQYYSLVAPAGQTPAVAASGGFLSVQPVRMPGQVERPQIVVTGDQSASLTLLNDSLWAAPLSEDFRRALALRLSDRLGAVDVPLADAPQDRPLWRIDVSVNRFESRYRQGAVLDATWRITPLRQEGAQARVCRSVLEAPAGDGVPALVAAHQQLVDRLAQAIQNHIGSRRTNATSNDGCTESLSG